MSSKIEILKKLREDLSSFISELIEIIPNEGQFYIMKSFIEYVIISDVADYIIANLVPIEDKVKARDEDFFLNNAVMFEKLQDYQSRVNHFKLLWCNLKDEEDKDQIWNWLQHFIDIGKRYQFLLVKNVS